jgi:GntR family transcriptional regulator
VTVLDVVLPDSGEPVFQQIARHLRRAILGGDLGPGERLPSESVLMEHYGVARMTVREALGLLKAEGLIVAEQGRGVFVREQPLVRRLGSDRFARRHRRRGHAAFTADALAGGQEPSVDSIVITRQRPPAEVAAALGVSRRSKVLVRQRRYLINGRPVESATSYIPLDVAEGTPIAEADTGPGGIYARMEDAGFVFSNFHEDIIARSPTPYEARALQLPPGVPVLLVTRYATETAGRTLEVCETVMAGHSFVLSYDLPAR